MLRSEPVHGVLVVDKPPGKTSAQVVAIVKKITQAKRVGHTGTLDPMATGVLPVCVGEGTKLAGYLQAVDKEYTGEFLLGVETDTLDKDGSVTKKSEAVAKSITRGQVEHVFEKFVGTILQTPPMFSAVKVGGKRLHSLARKGIEVERPQRKVEVSAFALEHFDGPVGSFRVACSKGTYVRTLLADVGTALGCGAHLTSLRRTRCGRFSETEAICRDGEDSLSLQPRLVPPPTAVDHLPGVVVPSDWLSWVENGRRIPSVELGSNLGEEVFRLLGPNGALLALAKVVDHQICYERVFSYALTGARHSSKLPRQS